MAQEIEVKVKVITQDAEKSFNSLNSSVKNLNKEVTNLDATFEEVYGDLKPLTTRMGEAEDRLYELALAGQTASQEYKDLLATVGNYRKTQIATDLVVDAAAQTMGSKLTGSLNAAAGGFSLAQGSMALFGAESSSVEAAMLKVQSAMAISQGVETINQSASSIKALGLTLTNTSIAQKALTTAKAAYTFVSNGATLATKAFRAALIATGIGAVVVAVGLLITNFEKIKTVMTNVIPGLKNVGTFIGNIVDQITDFVGATSDASRALDRLKKEADNTLSVNKKFMQEHGDQINEYTRKKIEAKNAYAEAVKEEGADEVALGKKLNRELIAIEYSRGDEKRKVQLEASKKAEELRKQEIEKQKQEAINFSKEVSTLEQSKFEQLRDIAAKSEMEKLELQKQRDLEEIEALRLKGANVTKLLEENTQIYNAKEAELQEKTRLDKEEKQKVIDEKAAADKVLKDEKDAANKIKILEEEKKFKEGQLAIDLAYENAKRNALDTGLNLLMQFAGKNKSIALGILAIQKGLAIADIVIGASKSIALAQANLAAVPAVIGVVPNPMFAVQAAATLKGIITTKIGAATSIASILGAGLGQAKSIAGGSTASGGSSGGGFAGGSMNTPMQVQPNPNVVGASQTNQIAETMALQGQRPIKTFVVANEVTTQQGLDRSIISSATLG